MLYTSPFDTQVFMVDLRANKKMIKAAVNELYEIQCKKINTLIRYVLALSVSGCWHSRGSSYFLSSGQLLVLL